MHLPALAVCAALFAILPLCHADDEATSVAVPAKYRKTVDLGDHTATYVKTARPVLAKAPPPPPPRPLSQAERLRIEQLEAKAHVTLNVTATVYFHGKRVITELRWRDENGDLSYRAYSNADFRYLRQLSHFETESTVYSWFPVFVDSHDLTEWPSDQAHPLPRGLRFGGPEAEYILDPSIHGLPGHEATLAGLDYLHAFYQVNFEQLKSAFEKREAEQKARERELRDNPPRPANTTLRFWPKTSSRN